MTKPNPYRITDEMVDDIVTTALEGGVDYWTARVSVVGAWPQGVEWASHVLTKGGTLRWEELQEVGGARHILTLSKMRKGIKLAAAHYRQTPEVFYEEHDAGAADVAVQFALLGEIVYG